MRCTAKCSGTSKVLPAASPQPVRRASAVAELGVVGPLRTSSMKTSLHILSLYLISAVSVLCSAASPKMPDAIARYYEDFNQLTILKLTPPSDDLSDKQAFTLAPPRPEVSAADTIQKRLNERKLSVDPRFSPQHNRFVHDSVFLRVTAFRAADGQMSVQCEVYEPLSPTSKSDLLPLDFSRMKLLRRETHQWRTSADQWILCGSIQQLTNGV